MCPTMSLERKAMDWDRYLRYGILVLVVFAGLWRPEWLRRHDRLVLTIYGVIWLATYALYLA